MTEFEWTREKRIEAMTHIMNAYGVAVDCAFKWRHDDRRHSTRKRVRAALNCDIEKYRYAKGCLEAFKSGTTLEESWAAEHEFGHNFEWKADKRWNHYFA